MTDQKNINYKPLIFNLLLITIIVFLLGSGAVFLANNEMGELSLISILNKLITALLAVLSMTTLLRWMDLQIDFNFKYWITSADDEYKVMYFCARILAVCIMMGLILLG